MSRFRQLLVAVAAGLFIATSGAHIAAQETDSSDVGLRAQMASITLDGASLPGGYVFTGEAFLTAEQIASAEIGADELTDAGLVSYYVSTYRSPDSGYEISTYVSAWSDADAAEAGFEVVEDEGRSNPDGTFEDAEAIVGESPSETTTGTYPDSNDDSVTVTTADATFRLDRFLIGASLETRDGATPDVQIVNALAATLEGRATAAINNGNPVGTDLELVPRVLPLSGLGLELQAGFLGAGDVEQMYGLQGSVLGGFTASWAEAVGLGDLDALQPYISVGVTTFAAEEDAAAIIAQIDNLAPEVPNAEEVDGVEIEGVDALVAYSFPSLATGTDDADSFRVVAVAGSTLVVIDVQGAPEMETARETATLLATTQVGCLGETSCAVPELPAALTGQE
ncbi:MAG: hypothetical protein ACR2GI_05725 [Thermomicrobiales bacterium]